MAEQDSTTATLGSTQRTITTLTAVAIGTVLLVLSGLTLTGTVVALVIATPVLVLFSPVLVPAAAVVTLAGVGFLFSGGFGVAALSALAWIYNYVAGKHPVGADQLDAARTRLASKARDLKEHGQKKAQDVTGGAS